MHTRRGGEVPSDRHGDADERGSRGLENSIRDCANTPARTSDCFTTLTTS